MTKLWLRNPDETIDWFLDPKNYPSQSGMCAQHSWHSIGGDKGQPPAWGAPNANAVLQKVKDAGELQKGPAPRGAYVLWGYGSNGHAAISLGDKNNLGDGDIATTDPSNGKPTGIEPATYPKRWGAKNGGTPDGWTTYYAGLYWQGDDMPLSDSDIRRIAKAVNNVLGDYDASGDVQDAADDNPQTGSTRLRQIRNEVTDG